MQARTGGWLGKGPGKGEEWGVWVCGWGGGGVGGGKTWGRRGGEEVQCSRKQTMEASVL